MVHSTGRENNCFYWDYANMSDFSYTTAASRLTLHYRAHINFNGLKSLNMEHWNSSFFLFFFLSSEGFRDNCIVPGLLPALLPVTAHNIFLTSLHMWQPNITAGGPFKPKTKCLSCWFFYFYFLLNHYPVILIDLSSIFMGSLCIKRNDFKLPEVL